MESTAVVSNFIDQLPTAFQANDEAAAAKAAEAANVALVQ
jgi:hypothetical protein